MEVVVSGFKSSSAIQRKTVQILRVAETLEFLVTNNFSQSSFRNPPEVGGSTLRHSIFIKIPQPMAEN